MQLVVEYFLRWIPHLIRIKIWNVYQLDVQTHSGVFFALDSSFNPNKNVECLSIGSRNSGYIICCMIISINNYLLLIPI